MNSKRDFDRAVEQWLDDGADATPPEVIDAVLLAVRSTPQERDFRLPWRATSMTSYLRVAAVVALAAIASTAAILSFGPSRFGGTNATPSPSPTLLARGNFFIRDWDRVEFEATRAGTSVTGRLKVGLDAARRLGPEHASDLLSVDLQCARTTEDGVLVIGGYTDESGGRFAGTPDGTLAAIVVKRGSPVKAQIWMGSLVNVPTTQTTDCLAYLDGWLTWSTRIPGDDWLRDDIEGTVEFGESGAEMSDRPSPAAGLPVGSHVMFTTVGLNEDRVAVTRSLE